MKRGYFQVRSGRLSAEYERALKKAARTEVAAGIMKRKAGMFTENVKVRKLIAHRLGWVDIASKMKRQIGAIEKFGDNVFKSGFKYVVLAGMGGSSLCPELFKLVHGRHKKLKLFEVIDSTDPNAIKALLRRIEIKKTLFMVASKSGGTVETRSHEAFFIERLRAAGVKNFGKHFVAITDKGSSLEQFARKNKYRKIFLNPSDIGGRYSALSYFGLVPGFFAGVDLTELLTSATAMEKIIRERTGETNPALVLGSLMAAGAKSGVNKMTFVASKKTAPLVPWIEQLVAESTGKQKKGVIPVENEPPGKIDIYGKDRFFVLVKMAGEKDTIEPSLINALIKQKFPIVEIALGSKAELGGQFLLWEAATAVAGYHLNINPFDEPNVTESKNNTSSILDAYQRMGQLPYEAPLAAWNGMSLIAVENPRGFTMNEIADVKKLLRKYFKGLKAGKYFTVLNYFRADRKTEQALEKIRTTVRDRTKQVTLRGYGPRYLHSIGQLFKGGPQEGLFVVFTRAHYDKLDIPGRPFDFGKLITAQAIGDVRALIKRKLPALVFTLEGDPAAGLEKFHRILKATLR
ncbi:MAG: glucose-6-phosphate isomerase [Candidatus Zixiibacteriota bacterium]